MKIRNGFVSNSSSSSFILPRDIDMNEVKEFVEKTIKKKINQEIKEIEETSEKINNPSYKIDYDSYIRSLKRLLDDSNISKNINMDKVKDLGWDLSEWYDELNTEDYVLYDEDDNFLNWIGEEIVEKFNIEKYCLHMG